MLAKKKKGNASSLLGERGGNRTPTSFHPGWAKSWRLRTQVQEFSNQPPAPPSESYPFPSCVIHGMLPYCMVEEAVCAPQVARAPSPYPVHRHIRRSRPWFVAYFTPTRLKGKKPPRDEVSSRGSFLNWKRLTDEMRTNPPLVLLVLVLLAGPLTLVGVRKYSHKPLPIKQATGVVPVGKEPRSRRQQMRATRNGLERGYLKGARSRGER